MRIFVKAKPRAKTAQVTKLDETHYAVSVTEPPVDNKANEAIRAALARHFSVPRNRMRLVSGQSRRQKIFEILP